MDGDCVYVCGRDGKVSKFQQTFYSVSGVVRKRAQHKEFEALQYKNLKKSKMVYYYSVFVY